MIYLDNAAVTSPKPECVINAVTRGMRLSANPGRSGHKPSLKASQEVFETRKALAAFFGSDRPENVIFTSNCTHSLNTAILGLIKENSHVICSDLEHNSVLRVLEKMKSEGKITYDIAKTYPSDDDTEKSFERLIKINTRAIVCTHASNVFSDVLPIERIGRLCKKHSLIFIVDAAQSAGVIDIDMKKMNITALCLPAQKGLYGAMGTGALLLKCDDIEPLTVGGTGSLSQSKYQPDYLPDRLESGTLNLSGIMGLRAGVKFTQGLSVKKIHEYETQLCSELYSFLKNSKKYEVLSKAPSPSTVPIVSFRHKNIHSEETAQKLSDALFCTRGGFHCAYLAHKSRGTDKSGLVRVSPAIFNSKNDIKKLINFLNKIET